MAKHETKIILDIDSPTHTQTHRAIKHYSQNRDTGLIVPHKYEKTCGGCGRRTFNLETAFYFNEEFCKDCVEKWKLGFK